MFRRTPVGLALVGLALAACDVPTEAPRWDQTWIVPADSITISVADLLPSTVEVTPDGSAFQAEVPGITVRYALSDLCPACPAGSTTVPKPEFRDTVYTSRQLPADLVSAVLTGGSLTASLDHEFSFDPLRPNDDPNDRGFLVIRVLSAGNLVAYDSISGEDQVFDASTTLVAELPVRQTTVVDSLTMEIIIYSPAGGDTQISSTDELTATFDRSTVQASEVTVAADAVSIDSFTTVFDFGVDSTLVDRIQNGAFLFDVMNPFPVTGTLDLVFQGGFPTFQRTIPISQGASTDTLAFSGPELQSILASDVVNIGASGDVSAPGGTITVTPDQELSVATEIQLVLLVGSAEDL